MNEGWRMTLFTGVLERLASVPLIWSRTLFWGGRLGVGSRRKGTRWRRASVIAFELFLLTVSPKCDERLLISGRSGLNCLVESVSTGSLGPLEWIPRHDNPLYESPCIFLACVKESKDRPLIPASHEPEFSCLMMNSIWRTVSALPSLMKQRRMSSIP